MSTYGRNFEFRVPPQHGQREGRWAVAATGTRIPIGAPIVADLAAPLNTMGLPLVKLAAADTAKAAVRGKGIIVYEFGPAAFAGDDAALVTYSDKDLVPLGAAVQLVHSPEVKVVFRNTVDRV